MASLLCLLAKIVIRPFRSSAFISLSCGKKKKKKKKKKNMSDRLSDMSGDTDLLTVDLVSVIPETPSVCDSPSWADATPAAPAVSPDLFSQSPSLNIPLPKVLADLMSSGASFDPVPAERWSTV